MLVAKVHRDRARAEQTAGARKEKTRRQKPAYKAKGSPPGVVGEKEAFAHRDAAAVVSTNQRHVNALAQTRRKRSSVVAIVKKRVEMLNMNIIAREFVQIVVSSN